MKKSGLSFVLLSKSKLVLFRTTFQFLDSRANTKYEKKHVKSVNEECEHFRSTSVKHPWPFRNPKVNVGIFVGENDIGLKLVKF